MNVLIVDDNESNLQLLQAILEAEAHSTVAAADGIEALELLERVPVDAVISDILMPRMDGYRLCYEVRRHARFNSLPFIVYTSTYTSPSDEATAIELGADLFLQKPAPSTSITQALAQAKRNAEIRPGRIQEQNREADRLKEYSQRLVEKLEKRNAELDAYAQALKKNEEEISHSREQLRVLAERLQAAREQERHRIARELHDGMGGMLMGIEIGLTWIQTKLKKEPVDLQALLKKATELDELVRDSARRVRQICTELRPSILDDLGLEAAIEWLGREFEARTSIACAIKIEGELKGHSPEQATAIFRIFQEILTNVARHAKATRVDGRIQQTQSQLNIQIKDNGIGIRTEQVEKPKTLGLLGMQERVAFLGGTLEIKGSDGEGTTVAFTLPVARGDSTNI